MALLLLTYANFVNILFQEFVYFEDKTGQHNSVAIAIISMLVANDTIAITSYLAMPLDHALL